MYGALPLIFRKGQLFGNPVWKMDESVVVATAFGKDPLKIHQILEERRKHYDITEIRADLFEGTEDAFRLAEKARSSRIPFIFTYRSTDISEARYAYAGSLKHEPAAIDLDLEIAPIAESMPRVPLIVSYHGKEVDVISKFKQILAFKPSACKIAIDYEDRRSFLSDLRKVGRFKRDNGTAVSLIPMGETYRGDRLLSAMLLSDLIYAALDTAAAPGQPTIEEAWEMKEITSEFLGNGSQSRDYE